MGTTLGMGIDGNEMDNKQIRLSNNHRIIVENAGTARMSG